MVIVFSEEVHAKILFLGVKKTGDQLCKISGKDQVQLIVSIHKFEYVLKKLKVIVPIWGQFGGLRNFRGRLGVLFRTVGFWLNLISFFVFKGSYFLDNLFWLFIFVNWLFFLFWFGNFRIYSLLLCYRLYFFSRLFFLFGVLSFIFFFLDFRQLLCFFLLIQLSFFFFVCCLFLIF